MTSPQRQNDIHSEVACSYATHSKPPSRSQLANCHLEKSQHKKFNLAKRPATNFQKPIVEEIDPVKVRSKNYKLTI